MYLKKSLFSIILQILLLFPVKIFADNDETEHQNNTENMEDPMSNDNELLRERIKYLESTLRDQELSCKNNISRMLKNYAKDLQKFDELSIKLTRVFLKYNSTIKFWTLYEDSKLTTEDGAVVSVNFPFNMYGKLHSRITIKDDGCFILTDFTYYPQIYIFLANIDTTYGCSISYRVSSNSVDLSLAQFLIERADPAHEGIKLTSALIVTYQDIPFWKSNITMEKCTEAQRNTFQGILATDGVRFFVIFNYIQLNWGPQVNNDYCTGQSSYIRAGFYDGNYRLIDNTLGDNVVEANYKELLTKTNIGIPGIFVTRVDQIPPN